VLGDRHDWDRLLRDLALAARAAIIFVEYTRSPEVGYPVAIEEAYATAREIGVDGKRPAVEHAALASADAVTRLEDQQVPDTVIVRQVSSSARRN
jgi:acetyl esterase/lipase